MTGRYSLGLFLQAIVAVALLGASAVHAAPGKKEACPIDDPSWDPDRPYIAEIPLPADYPPLDALRAEVETNLKEGVSGFAKDIGAFDGGARDWHPGGWCTEWRDNCTVCERAKDAAANVQCKQKHECSRMTQTYCTKISFGKFKTCTHVNVYQYRVLDEQFLLHSNAITISKYFRNFMTGGNIDSITKYLTRKYGERCVEDMANNGKIAGRREGQDFHVDRSAFDTSYTPKNKERVLSSLRDELLFQKLDANRIFECYREK